MERFSQRESVLLGYSTSQRSITINSSSSPKTSNRSSDFDFHDVFGGPPRRSSIHEKRFSFTEATKNNGHKGRDADEASMSRINPWSGLSERPVFGEENVNRRRYPSDDFFDDIFRGDESLSSSPRKQDRDIFYSAPGSRVVSPARSLPPKAEPFGSSLPPQFSLPAKLTKVDLPVFGSSSTTRSPYNKHKENASNGISFSYSPSSPLSRFSSEAIQGQEELKKDANKMEVPTNSGQFHFSIYKWACKGVPLVMPLRGGSRLRLKEQMKLERCSSSNGRLSSESTTRESSPMKTFGREFNQKETDPLVDSSAQDKVEPSQIVAETILPTSESETLSIIPSDVENVPGNTIVESRENPAPVVDISKNVKKQDGKKGTLNGVEVDKASFQDSGDNNLGRKRVKGKVKEFVKIFNQEASSKPKDNVDFRSQSSKWKKRGTFSFRAGNEASVSTTGRDEKVPRVHVNNTIQEASIMVDKPLKQSEKEHSAIKTSRQKDSSASETASIPDGSRADGSRATVEDTDESFQGIFLVEELPQDGNELPQSGDNHEEIQVIDTKIQYWSNGKKGNIRSLLSTLQYVLWPESGWKPVPLADIIEGNSVKRAYQKALLCLHPDKLQQKGAASQQKYIAEKVFDILQEAWTHFNSLGSI